MTTQKTELDLESLMRMTIKEAQKIKYMAGVEKYGRPFVGDPTVELHAEQIDTLNYADELERRGVDEGFLKEVRFLSTMIINRIRALYFMQANGLMGNTWNL